MFFTIICLVIIGVVVLSMLFIMEWSDDQMIQVDATVTGKTIVPAGFSSKEVCVVEYEINDIMSKTRTSNTGCLYNVGDKVVLNVGGIGKWIVEPK